MCFTILSTDLLASSLSFLAVVDVCRVGRASCHARDAATHALNTCTSLVLVEEPPFVNDSGLVHLLLRCTALTKIDIDARRLTDAGAAAVADALPRLRSVALHHGYGLSGIGCLTSRPRSRTNDDDEEDDNNNDENETGHNRASLMGVVTQNPPGRPSTVTLATPLPLPPPPPPPLIMKPVPYIALRSLTLCSLGPSYDFLSYSYSSTWSRLARQWIGIPTMRSLTLINNVGDMNFLPLLEIAPFFPKPTPRADGGSGARRSATFSSDDHRDPGRAPTRSRAPALPETQGVTTAVNAPAKKNDGVRAVRRGERRAGMRVDGGNLARVLREGHRKKTRMEEGLEKGKKDKRGSGGGNDDDNDDGTVGLLELSLAAVTWKDVVEALDVQPRFRVIRHRVMQGPSLRPLWVRLRRLSLVLDEVTDELCAAVAGGCPELHELSLRQIHHSQSLRQLSDTGLVSLARCQHLHSLNLKSAGQFQGCSDIGLVYMAMELCNLQGLSLCVFPRASNTTVAAILDHTRHQLRHLRLEGCEGLDGQVFIQPSFATHQSSRRLAMVSALTSISLARCRGVTPDSLAALVSACGPCLKLLDLSSCLVTDEVLELILGLPGLQDLTLNRCPFTNEGLIAACRRELHPHYHDHHCHQQQQQQQQHGPDPGEVYNDYPQNRSLSPLQFEHFSGRNNPQHYTATTSALNSPAESVLPLPISATSAYCRNSPRDNDTRDILFSSLPPPPPLLPPPQLLRRLSVAGCEEVEGSGVIELLRSARLGRHTLALGAMGIRGIYDGHVEELVAGLPCLQDLKLSNSPHLTNAAVASIVSSECGRNTLRVLELGRCPGIGGSALALVMPPALPALVRFGWWGAAGDVGEEALNRGGTCWIISGC